MYAQPGTPDLSRPPASQSLEIVANHLYATVSRTGPLSALKRLFGKNGATHLFTLNEVLRQVRIQGQRTLGVKTVNINQILGTSAEGRAVDFDINFRPLQQHNKERWLGVAAAWMSGRRLGRVKLLQVGDIFFVEDGHHRISVARAMGEQQIEAEVVMLLGTGTLSIPALAENIDVTGNPVLQPAIA